MNTRVANFFQNLHPKLDKKKPFWLTSFEISSDCFLDLSIHFSTFGCMVFNYLALPYTNRVFGSRFVNNVGCFYPTLHGHLQLLRKTT